MGGLLAAAAFGTACSGDDDNFVRPDFCDLPFDSGACDAAIPVYTFGGESCMPATYGGCEGNENRFYSLEQCLATCEGRPEAFSCPTGRVRATICIGCGPVGGCGETLVACAQPCSERDECDGVGFGCLDGVCQLTDCI
jgi:hypothetical protein